MGLSIKGIAKVLIPTFLLSMMTPVVKPAFAGFEDVAGDEKQQQTQSDQKQQDQTKPMPNSSNPSNGDGTVIIPKPDSTKPNPDSTIPETKPQDKAPPQDLATLDGATKPQDQTTPQDQQIPQDKPKPQDQPTPSLEEQIRMSTVSNPSNGQLSIPVTDMERFAQSYRTYVSKLNNLENPESSKAAEDILYTIIRGMVIDPLKKKDYNTAIVSLRVLEKEEANNDYIKAVREYVEKIAVWDIFEQAKQEVQNGNLTKSDELNSLASLNGTRLGIMSEMTEKGMKVVRVLSDAIDNNLSLEPNTPEREQQTTAPVMSLEDRMTEFEDLLYHGLKVIQENPEMRSAKKLDNLNYYLNSATEYKKKVEQLGNGDQNKERISRLEQYIANVQKELASCSTDMESAYQTVLDMFNSVDAKVQQIREKGVASDQNEFIVYESVKFEASRNRDTIIKMDGIYGFGQKIIPMVDALDRYAAGMQSLLDQKVISLQSEYDDIAAQYQQIKNDLQAKKINNKEANEGLVQLIARADDDDKKYGSNYLHFKDQMIEMYRFMHSGGIVGDVAIVNDTASEEKKTHDPNAIEQQRLADEKMAAEKEKARQMELEKQRLLELERQKSYDPGMQDQKVQSQEKQRQQQPNLGQTKITPQDSFDVKFSRLEAKVDRHVNSFYEKPAYSLGVGLVGPFIGALLALFLGYRIVRPYLRNPARADVPAC